MILRRAGAVVHGQAVARQPPLRPTICVTPTGASTVDLQDPSCPTEVRSLGRTIVRWRDQIVAWHQALRTNEPTEAVSRER